MNSNFLEALNESQKLSEGPVTQAISGAVNKVKGAIVQKNPLLMLKQTQMLSSQFLICCSRLLMPKQNLLQTT